MSLPTRETPRKPRLTEAEIETVNKSILTIVVDDGYVKIFAACGVKYRMSIKDGQEFKQTVDEKVKCNIETNV